MIGRIIFTVLMLGGVAYCKGSDTCEAFQLKKEYFNKRLVGHAVMETKVVSHHACARECMSLSVCKSIDYTKKENTCKVNDVDSYSVDESEFVTQKGAIFSDISDWPNNMIGKCSSRPCAINQRCIPTKEAYFCMDLSMNLASDCKGILEKKPDSVSGPYNVKLWQSGDSVIVYCDMETDGGGWTVFQRRFDGSVDFYRSFVEYENGFGTVGGESWLGLKYIQEFADQGPTELRADMSKADGETGYESYEDFSLSAPNYVLNIGPRTAGTGKISNGLDINNGHPFSTYDNDLDNDRINCAVSGHSGWWHNACTWSNLNGNYCTPPGNFCPQFGAWSGFIHYGFAGLRSLKTSKMMLRRL